MELFLEQEFSDGIFEDIIEELDFAYVVGPGSRPHLGSKIDNYLPANGAGKVGNTTNRFYVLVWDNEGVFARTTNNFSDNNCLNWTMEKGVVPTYLVITTSTRTVLDVFDISLTTAQEAIYTANDAPYMVNEIIYQLMEPVVDPD